MNRYVDPENGTYEIMLSRSYEIKIKHKERKITLPVLGEVRGCSSIDFNVERRIGNEGGPAWNEQDVILAIQSLSLSQTPWGVYNLERCKITRELQAALLCLLDMKLNREMSSLYLNAALLETGATRLLASFGLIHFPWQASAFSNRIP